MLEVDDITWLDACCYKTCYDPSNAVSMVFINVLKIGQAGRTSPFDCRSMDFWYDLLFELNCQSDWPRIT